MFFYTSIKNTAYKYFYKIANDRVKNNLLQAIPFWIASFVTGLVAVGYAKLFSFAEKGTKLMLQYNKWWLFLVAPISFLLSWIIAKEFAPFSRGSGIPQVMAAIELSTPKNDYLVKKLLSIRIIVVKIISNVILVLGGGATGREGPTIQIAASIFRKVNSILPSWWPKVAKRNMIITGAAAGLAAAFNTPLGGIVFTVEELTKMHISFYKTALFSAVIIAGLTAQAMFGPYLYLGFPKADGMNFYVFVAILIVAVISGIAASLMCKLILKIFRLKKNLKGMFSQVLFVIGCALILAFLACCIDESTLGSGKELMTNLLFTKNKYTHWYTSIVRIIGPIVTFCSGGAGGVFAPALSAGACIGSFFSHVFLLNDEQSNVLILSGMVAFLTGLTRTPFTSAILVLEMTDRHNLIFQLMLAGMIASIAAMIIDQRSFYDHLKEQYCEEVNE